MPYVPPNRARRIASQAVMWVILLATVGVAALVNRTVKRTADLSQVVTFDRVQAAFPKGWTLESQRALISRGPGLMVIASPTMNDADSVQSLRQIRITQEQVGPSLSPESYLKDWLQVPGPFMPFNVGGREGVLGLDESELEVGGAIVRRFSLCAVTVTKPGLAVSVRLDGYKSPLADDKRLLKQICDAMQILDR